MDFWSPEKRSQVMAGVRSRGNRSTELAMVAALKRLEITGWRRHHGIRISARPLSGTRSGVSSIVKPDFVFSLARLVVFVDGCFWHSCPKHRTAPKTNAKFWRDKLAANRRRDQRVSRCLRRAGWTVVRVWEHDIKKAPDACARRILRLTRLG